MPVMNYIIILLFTMVFTVLGQSGIETRVIEYKHGDTVLEGYLAYDGSIEGKRPGILVVHEWYGNNDYSRMRARQLAEMGYVAFALDMYGKGVIAKNAEEASKLAQPFYEDRQLMRDRAAAGLDVLLSQEMTDQEKIGAIGFCFGGTTVLELARSGADVDATVSFHGGLQTPHPEDAKNIKGSVLANHGADDPYVKREEVLAFQDEMRNANVDWQMNIYGNAVHSFTNPAAGNDNSTGAAYNEKAARRAWKAMQIFFDEILK